MECILQLRTVDKKPNNDIVHCIDAYRQFLGPAHYTQPALPLNGRYLV